MSRIGIYSILYAHIFVPPAARDRSREVPSGPHPVRDVPEGYGGASGPLSPRAIRNGYGVRAPTVDAYELMRESVRLAALRIIADDVVSSVTCDSQQFAVAQCPACRLQAADERDRLLLPHGLRLVLC